MADQCTQRISLEIALKLGFAFTIGSALALTLGFALKLGSAQDMMIGIW